MKNIKDIVLAAKNLAEIKKCSPAPQEIYVIEECAELITEITKHNKTQSDRLRLIEEACDVIAASSVFIMHEYADSDSKLSDCLTHAYNTGNILFINCGPYADLIKALTKSLRGKIDPNSLEQTIYDTIRTTIILLRSLDVTQQQIYDHVNNKCTRACARDCQVSV